MHVKGIKAIFKILIIIYCQIINSIISRKKNKSKVKTNKLRMLRVIIPLFFL
jgi:hypothetical protein